MKNTIRQISSSMEETRAVADTIGLCRGATPQLQMSCFDGKAATNKETPGNPGDEINNIGSLMTYTADQKPLVDQLGNTRTNIWL
tara:strand:- start:84 stop:338 length:255 start_codon:yes stop_codon:yes gene_type:complete